MCPPAASPTMGLMTASTIARPPAPRRTPSAGHRPPTNDTILGRVGGWCFDHRRAAVGMWIVTLALVFAAAGMVGP
jgi:hypothetical protein